MRQSYKFIRKIWKYENPLTLFMNFMEINFYQFAKISEFHRFSTTFLLNLQR